ncbi:MAG: IMP dehydrogenase, partial [Erysipelotrichaceae bacterium]|nr:IMP dehydrogenase [Erysipelotrichaceae bacterium]
MAKYIDEVSRTFNEYLLIPGHTTKKCTPDNVSLKTPVVRYKKGQKPSLTINIPMVSASMQSVSGDELAVALAAEGGISFIFCAQSIESQADMIRRAKAYKAGFVPSDSNIKSDATLQDVLDLKERTKHSTMAVTDDGTGSGKLLGIITSRDYRISRTPLDAKVSSFMTPLDKLITAYDDITLSEANDVIWDHKLNTLPIIDKKGNLKSLVFRKDYESHKDHPNELLDDEKRYIVGAGINSRDYKERVPALVEAGADILCIDSSEGFSDWQKETLEWIRKKYNGKVKCGAGNVVDGEGFNFLADAGADFVKVGIGGGS